MLSIGHSWGVSSCKISHTYFTLKKFGHSLYSLTLHWCPCPLFTSSSITTFASRKTWHKRIVHSWPSSILQSKIKTESSGVRTPYVVSQLSRIWESIFRFICLYPYSQAIFKPYLTAQISAILFKAMPMWIEKPFIHLPLLSLNTPPPSALPILYLELPSVFKVTKEGCGGRQYMKNDKILQLNVKFYT